MEITKKNYNLHYKREEKFNISNIKFVFSKNVEEKDITYTKLLIQMLENSNSVFETERDLVVGMEELLVYNYSLKVKRVGNHFRFVFSISYVNDKFSKTNLVENIMKFLSIILFNPKTIGDSFDEKNLAEQKKVIKNNIESVAEYPSSYAFDKFRKEIDQSGKFSYSTFGDKEILNNIDGKKLYEYYKSIINDWQLDIFLVGDTKPVEVEEHLKKMFSNRISKVNLDKLNYEISSNEEVKEIVENYNTKQSELIIGYTANDINFYEETAVIKILLGILNGASGKLFKEVREKNSFCYSILMDDYVNFGIFAIKTKISSKNYEKAKDLSISIVNEVKGGNISLEFNVAKKNAIKAVLDRSDSIDSISSNLIKNTFQKGCTLEKEIDLLKSVTEADVVEFAKKLKLNTIYLLKEE